MSRQTLRTSGESFNSSLLREDRRGESSLAMISRGSQCGAIGAEKACHAESPDQFGARFDGPGLCPFPIFQVLSKQIIGTVHQSGDFPVWAR